ncbi:unnamed protein product [Cochlearia groenlandica]
MTNVKKSSQVNLPYLPDDLLLKCFSCISRVYYPNLSLVSKRFRYLIASLEGCLYVSLSFTSDPNPRWFSLCRKPTQNPKLNPNPNMRWFTSCFRQERKHTRSDHVMVSIPTNKVYPPDLNCFTVVGSDIYMIGGYINGVVSSSVYFMDCRFQTWHEAPSMSMARNCPLVSVVDGKIYVVEGLKDIDSSDFVESFDPKTQIWERVTSPSPEIIGSRLYKSLSLDGKLYLFGTNNIMVYEPKEGKWSVVQAMDTRLSLLFYTFTCVIDNVNYYFGSAMMIEWYDTKARHRKVLKGLEELRSKLPKHSVRLVNHGGNIVVLWQKSVDETAIFSKKNNNNKKNVLWCAEIALERCDGGREICGKVKWCDVVLTVPNSSLLQSVFSVTI